MFATISSRLVIAHRETYGKNCTSNSEKQTTEVIKKKWRWWVEPTWFVSLDLEGVFEWKYDIF